MVGFVLHRVRWSSGPVFEPSHLLPKTPYIPSRVGDSSHSGLVWAFICLPAGRLLQPWCWGGISLVFRMQTFAKSPVRLCPLRVGLDSLSSFLKNHMRCLVLLCCSLPRVSQSIQGTQGIMGGHSCDRDFRILPCLPPSARLPLPRGAGCHRSGSWSHF